MTTLTFALPDQSFLLHTLQRCHYIDRCQKAFTDRDDSVEMADVVQAFFSANLCWVQPLVTFRNKVAGILGLKPFPSGLTEHQNWWYNHKAERLISFPLHLFSHSENEIVLGADDKHLDFRISFFVEKCPNQPGRKLLTITTMVQFNNAWGRVYFMPVQPIHKLVVPALLRSAVRTIGKKLSRKQES